MVSAGLQGFCKHIFPSCVQVSLTWQMAFGAVTWPCCMGFAPAQCATLHANPLVHFDLMRMPGWAGLCGCVATECQGWVPMGTGQLAHMGFRGGVKEIGTGSVQWVAVGTAACQSQVAITLCRKCHFCNTTLGQRRDGCCKQLKPAGST